MERKEAIEVIKKNWPDSSFIMLREALETVIPELAESEDERIRKHLIGVVELYYGNTDEQEKKDCLAWLENQGEQNPIDKIQLGKKYKCIASPRYSTFRIGKIYKPEDKFLCSLMNFCSDCFEPIEDEQKPADNVEPKFKIGDIIINKENGAISKVNKILSYDYELISFETGKHSILDQTLININRKLWTIQDAKDGDVLSFNDGHGNDSIELIKSITDKKIEFWFCLTNGNRYEVFDGIIPYTNLVSREGATPATKEQRDLLFQKMKEAGYEWNAENKELKKIEQKPAYTKEYDFHGIKFIPKFAKGDIIKDKKCGEVSTIEDFSYDTGLYTHTYGQFPITIQDNYEIIAQKPAWSKEDEKIIRRIDSLLYSQCKIHGSEYEEIHNWLKSLRPQNTWKPSDVQMEALDDFIYAKYPNIEKYGAAVKSLYQDLKKLKENKL